MCKIKCESTRCKNNSAEYIDSPKQQCICSLTEISLEHCVLDNSNQVCCKNFIEGNKSFLKPYEEGYTY